MALRLCAAFVAVCFRCCYAFDSHVAPMVGYTDRHFRSLLRLSNPDDNTILWTEMLKPAELLAAPESRRHAMLSRGADTGSCVLQLGGDTADDLCAAVEMAEHGGYDYRQYDLNCGCPSVHTNAPFGAALMKRPGHVLYLCDRMASSTDKPISIKCRIGTHDTPASMQDDSLQALLDFLSKVTSSGAVRSVVIHARAAVLSGLSIEKNREVPPLRADIAIAAAKAFPNIRFVLNGELEATDCVPDIFAGAMYGRCVVRDPLYLLGHSPAAASAAAAGGGQRSADLSRRADVVAKYCVYACRHGLYSLQNGEAAAGVLLPLALTYLAAMDTVGDGAAVDSPQLEYIRVLLSSILSVLQQSRHTDKEGSKIEELAFRVDSCYESELSDIFSPVGRALKDAIGKKVFTKIIQTRERRIEKV